ncbi:MAG: YhfC family intramembrane metalloprotease, partial [Oscillospiraceae bacterium]|nr:YhfC family intramembrane metalloprotease [Oscillospiraceae bacterium]
MVKLNGIAVAIYFAFSLIILVCALVFIRLRLKTKIKPCLIGGLTWLLFATLLEGSVHGVVLSIVPGLRENTLAFAIYGGLMAGIFEELGRYLAFKVFFKRDMENDKNALAYAAGHGGFEATYLLITGALGMIVMASLINSGLGA